MLIGIVSKKKRQFRQLWIIRINAAVREYGMSYSSFISRLKKYNIELNRKIISNMAMFDKESFKDLILKINVN